MADNVTLPGTGSVIAADDIGGIEYQRVKLSLGSDGSATDLPMGEQAKASSMPVALSTESIAQMTELLEQVGAVCQALTELAERLDIYPDGAGNLRISVQGGTLPTVSTVSSVTTVSTVTTVSSVNGVTTLGNLTNFGSAVPAEQVVFQSMRIAEQQQINDLFPVS